LRSLIRGNTVAKLLVDAGHACAAYQNKALRNLPCKRVQMDEILRKGWQRGESDCCPGNRWRPLDLDRDLRRYQVDC
jgi:hypothetical protein